MVQREQAQRRARRGRFGGAYGRVVPAPLGEIPAGREAGADDGHLYTQPGALDAARGAEANDPQTLGSGFQAIGLQDQFDLAGTGSIPPDTMGAVGPNHFVENINSSVAIYTKAGALVSHVTLTNFFTFNDGAAFPANGAFDPRIIYDRRSGRWFATAMERGAISGTDNDIALAVSETDDPTGTWDFYRIPLGQASSGGTNFFTDYSTLGTDDNGVYFGARIFASNNTSNATIAATPIASLLAGSPSLSAVTQFTGITDMYSTPQPAHNQSAVGATDPAWFVSSSTLVFGNVVTRKITWSGGTPSLSAITTVTTPTYAAPINAPASGSTTNVNVGDDRLQMAMLRDGRLWTARTVGLNSTGGSSGADRTGCEWFELNVSTGTATVLQNGRVFDPAGSGPRFYYYPSIMVSGQGHAAMGFSGSKASEFIGAYTCGRLVSDSAGTMQAVILVKAGEDSYTRNDTNGRNRWGDYSYTSLDPNDDMTLWTLQEYAEDTATASVWGTWVAPLLAPAPTMNNPTATAMQGQNGATLNLTGTGFYDPGSGFTNRLDLTISGDGISGKVVTFNDSASVTVTYNVSGGATAGSRNITLTNPDGQAVTVTGGLTITTASLGAPTNLDATAVTATRIDLSWTDNANAETGFKIERKTGAGSFTQIGAVGANITTYINQTGLSPETEYTYKVRAYNGSGNSAYSNEDTATTLALPAAPSDLAGTLVVGPRINLTWTDNTSDETRFYLYRKVDTGFFAFRGSVNANLTAFSDTKVQPGKTYTYFIRAVSPAGTSANSNQTAVVVPSLPIAPNNLTAQAFTGPRRVVLNWNDRSDNEDRFYLYRKTGGGSYVFKGSVLADVTTITDSTVASGVTYTYAVKAGNAAGYSGLSFPAATVSVP